MNHVEKEEQLREEMTYAARQIVAALKTCQERMERFAATGRPTPHAGIAFEDAARAVKALTEALDFAENPHL
jgi:hypothetical protein